MRPKRFMTQCWPISLALTAFIAASVGGSSARADGLVLDGIVGWPELLNQNHMKELKLSKEQIEKVEVIVQDHAERTKRIRQAFVEKSKSLSAEERKAAGAKRAKDVQASRVEAGAKLKGVLSPQQMRRYKQLTVWWFQPGSWTFPDVQAALKLTAEQKDKVRLILEDNLKETPTVNQLRKSGIEAKRIPEMKRILVMQNNERTTARIVAEVLDEGQKVLWEEIVGEAPPIRPYGGNL